MAPSSIKKHQNVIFQDIAMTNYNVLHLFLEKHIIKIVQQIYKDDMFPNPKSELYCHKTVI